MYNNWTAGTERTQSITRDIDVPFNKVKGINSSFFLFSKLYMYFVE